MYKCELLFSDPPEPPVIEGVLSGVSVSSDAPAKVHHTLRLSLCAYITFVSVIYGGFKLTHFFYLVRLHLVKPEKAFPSQTSHGTVITCPSTPLVAVSKKHRFIICLFLSIYYYHLFIFIIHYKIILYI